MLFIIATAAGLSSTALTPALTGTDYLTRLAAHGSQTTAGALLYIIGALASVGIAIALYPVLKERNAGLALGSVIFRTVETAFYMVGVVSLLSVLTLGRQFTAAAAADRTSLQAIGDSLVSVHDHAGLLGVFAFSVGGFLYYYLFFQSRLIPRWLSGWGIVAVVLMLTACVLALFSDNPVTGYIPLAFPIFLQEMVLAVWLIVKGFRPPVSAARSGRRETSALLGVSESG